MRREVLVIDILDGDGDDNNDDNDDGGDGGEEKEEGGEGEGVASRATGGRPCWGCV
jgi:hypothetical protein